MAGGGVGGSYSKKVGFIYIFNLVVGVGALALPLAFKEAGLILGPIFLAIVATIAYMCITFIIETMAASNALLKIESRSEDIQYLTSQSVVVSLNYNESSEDTSNLQALQHHEEKNLITKPVKKKRRGGEKHDEQLAEYYSSPFAIDERTEIGLLASQFLGPFGKYLFYLIIVIYLFGDLAIYAVAVPSTLLKVTGGIFGMTHAATYRVYVGIFGAIVVPFSFFNFQKTKYLQMFTLFTRNLAFFIMILLSLIFVINGEGASIKNLNWFRIQGLGTLYGTTIYAFMCHHSLPSIVSPIKNKKGLSVLFAGDFLMIFSAYIVMCFSALFAFGDQPLEKCPDHVQPGPPCQIQKLYTLNFTTYNFVLVGGFLSLFPVFTLTTNYPLISITMRNNLQTLFQPVKFISDWKYNRFLFSALSAIPPIAVALITDNISFLVSLTGSIAGVFIQFIFPALLVFFSRYKMKKVCQETGVEYNNPHTSPFKHSIWAIAVFIIGLIGFFVAIALQIIDIVQSFRK